MEKSAKTKKIETIKHIVTQEDLDNNPDLVTQGIKIGDEIDIPKPANKLDELMQPYLKAYPNNKTFYISSDGQVFLEQNKQFAVDHQKTIDANTEVGVYEVK
jgi:hypothetical protein